VSDEFTLRQDDLARGDFYEIRSELDVMQARLALLPTRGELAQAALGIIFCSAVLTALFLRIVLH
jgi:hypothetical protein